MNTKVLDLAHEHAQNNYPNSTIGFLRARSSFIAGYQAAETQSSGLNKQNIIDLEQNRFEWSLTTFPEATPISSLRKLESEIKEIEADIIANKKVPEEYADALMCLFDSAGRHGIGPEEIFEAFALKLIKNKNRTWVKNPDNSYSHVK